MRIQTHQVLNAAAAVGVALAVMSAPGGLAATDGLAGPGRLAATGVVAAQDQVPDVLTRSRAAYANMTSYADTGTVVRDLGGLVDSAKFKTYLRRPNDLYFEYYDHVSVYPSTGFKLPVPTRRVLWMLKGELEDWDAVGKTHGIYPRAEGRQVSALVNAGARTEYTAVLIPSLFFTQAKIFAAVQELVQATVTGEEAIDGRRCHKVAGVARSVYASGAVTNVRPVTIWIDVENLLIRKIFEDTPKGNPIGTVMRRTVTYQPQLNPTLTDAQFTFKVPGA